MLHFSKNKQSVILVGYWNSCSTGGKFYTEIGTLNKHKILHDEEKVQNLQDMWEIIHGDWDLEQT